MVWLIAFLCGAVVMALEILGARILQPYFGSGILTWASLIAVFLAAMSGGYFLGGWLADRFPTFAGLGLLLLLASGSILLILPMERWLFPSLETARNFAVGMESLPERLAGRYGVLVAAAMFFWLPAMLLATASPYLIRLASKSVATTGRTAGGIYAVSTVGSIVGTLGCAFVLLPQQGVRTVLWELALVIAVVAIVCLLTSYRPRNGRHWLTVLLLPLLFSVASARVIYQRESLYHRIVVEDVGNIRYLRFDASYQSGMDLRDPDRAVFPYTDYLHLGIVFKPDAQKVLFVGLGGATAPKKFRKDYPSMTIHIAEIDPAVKEVAEQFFGFREDEQMKVFLDDGRVYLRKTKETYDLIVLDAYFGSRYEVTLPFHLVTREFFELAKARLSDEGVVVFNLVGRLEGAQSRVTRAILKTMRAVFPELYLFPVEYRQSPLLFGRRNLIVIAPKRPLRWTPDTIVNRARQLVQEGKVKVTRLPDFAADLYRKPIPTDDVPILTDDYAPVEFLNP
jgi:spermidine synthase